MRRSVPMLAMTIAAALLLVGCGAPDEDVATPETPDEAEDPMEDDADGRVAADLDAEVDQAVADAAETAGVSDEDIEVVAAEHVTWSDGAIGCPEPDGMYTQALVEGYRILLRVAGEEVAYHGADGQPPFRCDDPMEPVEDDTM